MFKVLFLNQAIRIVESTLHFTKLVAIVIKSFRQHLLQVLGRGVAVNIQISELMQFF